MYRVHQMEIHESIECCGRRTRVRKNILAHAYEGLTTDTIRLYDSTPISLGYSSHSQSSAYVAVSQLEFHLFYT